MCLVFGDGLRLSVRLSKWLEALRKLKKIYWELDGVLGWGNAKQWALVICTVRLVVHLIKCMWVYNLSVCRSLAVFYWSLVCTWKSPLNVAIDISIESFITVHCEIHQSITFIIVMCTVYKNKSQTTCTNCTCLRGHFTIFHCLLHLFIIVKQILSIIAYTYTCISTQHIYKEKSG